MDVGEGHACLACDRSGVLRAALDGVEDALGLGEPGAAGAAAFAGGGSHECFTTYYQFSSSVTRAFGNDRASASILPLRPFHACPCRRDPAAHRPDDETPTSRRGALPLALPAQALPPWEPGRANARQAGNAVRIRNQE